MNPLAILETLDLHCVRNQQLLFAPISFALNAGEALLIEGDNGSGKSSLLRLLTGLSTPHEGHVLWQTQSIQTIRDEYATHLHYLGHTNGLKLGLSVEENLILGSHLALATPLIENALEQWQLNSLKHKLINQLSAGQKRRVALAKLNLTNKPLWILDEPLTALDAQIQQIFFANLESHLNNGGIAIISSHHSISHPNIKKLRLEAC